MSTVSTAFTNVSATQSVKLITSKVFNAANLDYILDATKVHLLCNMSCKLGLIHFYVKSLSRLICKATCNPLCIASHWMW